MGNIVLFGNKEEFAIQLGLHANVEKCKLCFFVQGRKMGSFTKGGELKYSIRAYNTFIANKERYFFSVFEKMTATEIVKYLVIDLFSLGKSTKKEKVEEYEKRKNLQLFFGSQFTNDGCEIILLYKNSEAIFIYNPPRKVVSYKYVIGYDILCRVFDEYISYCAKNRLI